MLKFRSLIVWKQRLCLLNHMVPLSSAVKTKLQTIWNLGKRLLVFMMEKSWFYFYFFFWTWFNRWSPTCLTLCVLESVLISDHKETANSSLSRVKLGFFNCCGILRAWHRLNGNRGDYHPTEQYETSA